MCTSFVRRPFTGTWLTAKQHTQNTSHSFTGPHKENFRQRTTSTQVVFTEEHTRVTRMDTYRRCFANDNQFNGGSSVRLTNSLTRNGTLSDPLFVSTIIRRYTSCRSLRVGQLIIKVDILKWNRVCIVKMSHGSIIISWHNARLSCRKLSSDTASIWTSLTSQWRILRRSVSVYCGCPVGTNGGDLVPR